MVGEDKCYQKTKKVMNQPKVKMKIMDKKNSAVEINIHHIYISNLCIYIYIYTYTWKPNDPCFECSSGLLLKASFTLYKIINNTYTYITTVTTRGHCFHLQPFPFRLIRVSFHHQTFQVPKIGGILTYRSCMDTAYVAGSFPTPKVAGYKVQGNPPF